MARINEILDKLNDNAHAVVDLPAIRTGIIRCNALLIKRESPGIELVFPPHSWDAEDLKIGTDCNVVVDHKGLTVNLIARLDEIVGDRRLRFIAREPILPESLREYFRVAISIPIEASYIAGAKETKTQTWKMHGTTLDLSGSGVLALFEATPPSQHRIQLILTPQGEEVPIVCLANVVRVYRIRNQRYQVAFHFETISTKTRDQLIACCLQEQRRQLRENVQTV